MCCRLFWLAVFAASTLKPGSAQEAFKVEPTHYKLDFENENVQVVNIHYGPHEKSSLHSHPGGVVVTLTAGHLKFTDEHGKVRETHSLPGEARWFPPFKHSVENLGDSPYNAVYIGIKMDHRSGLEKRKGGEVAMNAKMRVLVAQALASAK